jgi:hypothetical protein
MQVFQCLQSRIAGLAAVTALATGISFGQAATSAAPTTSQTANGASPVPCSAIADSSVPVNATVEAKVAGLDSAHLKADKEIWFNIAHGVSYPSCTLEANAVVYARIVSVTSSKTPGPAELSLDFNRADCSGHDKQAFKLRIIAIIGPAGESHKMHNDMPTEVAGKGRQISDAMAGTNALDMDLNPGGPPHTVHPGIVVGAPKLKLEPTAGPGCTDKISSTDNRVQLGPGSELVLAVTELRPQ